MGSRGGGRFARRVALLGIAVLVTMGAASSCSSGDESDGDRPPATADAPAVVDYIGLSKARAIAKAEAADVPWRIGREDKKQFALTQDFVEDRVTFEIDDGKVTKATFG